MNSESKLSNQELSVLYRVPLKCDFKVHPIWFEYGHPKQLSFLKNLGFSEQWLLNQFVVPVAGTNKTPWFSMSGLREVPKTEMHVCSAIISFGRKFHLKGMIYIVDQEIRSCEVFSKQNEYLVLYLNDLFNEENVDIWTLIANEFDLPEGSQMQIEYRLDVNDFFIEQSGKLDIPYASG